MRGTGSCWSTGSAGSAAAAAEASATGASRRYRMLPLLVRTQSSLRRRLRWRESESREAGMLSSVYWFSAAWWWLLLLRYCSRRWVRDGGGCTAAPADMFALWMTVVMIWGRGGGACSGRELGERGKVGISRMLARQRHQGQRTGPFRPPIINEPGGEPKQTGRQRPASRQAVICGGGKR